MPQSEQAELRDRVLILAPAGRDAVLTQEVLARAELSSLVCHDVGMLLAALAEEAVGACLLTEEALLGQARVELLAWVQRQPPWSDLPFILLMQRGTPGTSTEPELLPLQQFGNVTVLDRPITRITLVSAVRAALRARRRQYEVHDTLAALAESEARYRGLADDLERLVAERTARLEEANRKLNAEMAERQRTEEQLRQVQKLEAVGQLTSGVAHDFNNLLTAVLGNLELLEQRAADAGIQRLVRSAARAAQRGASLTQQLLAFSRKQRLVPQPVDLNKLVAHAAEMLQRTMGATISLSIELADEPWPALVDPTQIDLVLLNLAINARDAMPEGGTLRVRTENIAEAALPAGLEPGNYVMMAVSDTGTGMAPDVLARAIDPFFTTKDVGKGSGLGLSMVHGVATQSGGCLRIESTPGRGTTVRVYLPRAVQMPEEIAMEALRQSTRHGEATILVVDDDPDVRELTTNCLQGWGYRVLGAENGDMALEMLKRAERVDLLIVDMAMPRMNGVEVVRRARAERPDLPALLVTGYIDFASFRPEPGDQILHKPYQVEKLAEAVAAALSGEGPGQVIPLKQRRNR